MPEGDSVYLVARKLDALRGHTLAAGELRVAQHAAADLAGRSVLHGGDGRLARPDEPEDWIRFANRALDDPAGHAALGESAARVVRERYDRDATVPRLAERLNQLAGLGG